MRKFDFYEFSGVIVPGTVFLVGAAVCSEQAKQLVFDKDVSIGEAALSVIVAYGLGHLVQALGNMIELVWWRAWGGMPSDWPRSGKRALLADGQMDSLHGALSIKLGCKVPDRFGSLSADDWHSVVRQVYAAVASEAKSHRIDVFNGNYALARGLAAALLAVGVVILVTHGLASWRAVVLLLVGAGVAAYRMHRFGVHYARELFVQFLQLTPKDGGSPQGLKE